MHQPGAELVQGEAFGWTSRAVQVTWEDAGIRRTTWVWVSAVQRRNDPVRKTSLGFGGGNAWTVNCRPAGGVRAAPSSK